MRLSMNEKKREKYIFKLKSSFRIMLGYMPEKHISVRLKENGLSSNTSVICYLRKEEKNHSEFK